jgi:hypothetical protein
VTAPVDGRSAAVCCSIDKVRYYETAFRWSSGRFAHVISMRWRTAGRRRVGSASRRQLGSRSLSTFGVPDGDVRPVELVLGLAAG